jgi:4-alpha-glucanotransferase
MEGMVKEKIHTKVVGTLAPIFSLTTSKLSPEDQGTFEAGIYFLDWLHKTKQTAWQILPVNETQLEKGSPTKHVPSPYKGYGIGLAPKYLSSKYAKMRPSSLERNAFIAQQKGWLEDYALFCSIRDVYGTDDWRTWDSSLRKREKGRLREWAKEHKMQINFYIVQQWQLQQSYSALHERAKALGISLIGDFPYYLSVNSPLVWSHQKAFCINKDGTLPAVSGIPFTETTHFGRQVWGHPLYNWDSKEEIMKLWKLRLDYQAMLFEDIRFDHAKAFFSYGVMDPSDEANDHYTDGPGSDVFKEILAYGHDQGLKIFAEDSGDKTGDLRDCLNQLQIPGIKIYRFAMKLSDGIINEKYAAMKKYPTNCVAYTTTHDTSTLLEYVSTVPPEQKMMLAKASDISFSEDNKTFAASIRDAVVLSPAQKVIIPIQDWLLSTDRINLPGTEKEVGDTNWQYRIDRTIEKLPTNIL